MRMTEHAMKRCRQRGVTDAMMAAVLAHADREAHCGGGCTAVQISRRSIERMTISADTDPERLRNLVVVLNDAGDIVTVLRARDGAGSRRYRRGLN